MKRLLLILSLLLLPIHIACATETPARNITNTVSSNPKCLNPSIDTNVQQTINDLDQCIATGGVVPGSPLTSFQYNNSGIFSGGNMYQFNGNIGIGSINPITALDVVGGVRLQGFSFPVGSALTGKVLISDANGNGTWQNSIAGSGTVNNGNVGDFSYYASTGNAVSDQNVLQINNGNIGIGTPNPINTFQVNGGIQANGFFGPGIIAGLTAGYFPTAYSPNIIVNSNMFKPPTSNNIGIGSLNPGQALDIQGTNRMTGFQLPTGAVSGYTLISNSQGIGTWQPAPISGVSSVTASSPLASSGGGTPNISVSSSTGSGAIVLQSSPELIGNVGIGSITPGQSLDVKGTTRTTNLTIGTLGGILKATSGNVGTAISGTDYAPATSGTSILKGSGSGGFANAAGGVDYEFPLTFSTGLTRTVNTIVVNNSQSIVRLSNLTTNGFVTTTSSNGTLLVVPLSSIAGLWESNNVGIDTFNNVGIGSTNPGQNLDVVGTGRFSNSVVIGSGGPGAAVLVGYQGNIGIGSTAPDQALDVQGTVRDLGEIVNGNVGIGTPSLATLSVLGQSGQTAFYLTNPGNVTAIEYDLFGNFHDTSGASPGFYYDNNSAAFGFSSGNSNPLFITTNANGSTAANLYIIPTGNVGIGTFTAPQKLSVQGGIGMVNGAKASMIASNGIDLNPTGGQNLIVLTGSNNFGIGSYWPQGGDVGIGTGAPSELLSDAASFQTGIGSRTHAAIYMGFDKTTGLYNPAEISHGIGFLNNGNESARFDQNGNLGIGSTAPSQKLDVQGTLRMTGLTLTGNGAANGYVMVGNNVGIGTWMPASTLPISGGTGTNYWLNDTGNVGISTIYAVGIGTTFVGGVGEASFSVMNGNVGIGTWTPTAALQVQGTVNATALQVGGVNSCLSNGTNCPPGTGDPWLTGSGAGNVGLSTTYSVGIGTTMGNGAGLIVMNGNVGIGTWNPSQNLQIDATTATIKLNTLTGTTAQILNSSATAASELLINGGASSTSDVRIRSNSTSGTTDNIKFQLNNGVDVMRIQDNSGVYSIGIGTTAPQTTLSVLGNIGIGTWTAAGGSLIVVGNVGVGSISPQASIDLGTNGTLTSHRTTGIGFTTKAQANTACNTTCGSSACVFGMDAGTLSVALPALVTCADATADYCVCAGP